ncbi:uncharacterized protein LOC110675973 [Aedes aegypti]|uniref:Uncharacterized protein n=1 Tax=Aedes aegypti TaxID=7159 RepID=A0A6I8U1I8_AEDAE|nr:uncharacterized protein LOC110675973 [Aedes aegypti]
MALIEKVYSLELQAQVNYSGAGGKYALKILCSTQVLIKALVDHSLFDNTEDPGTQACAEFRYQMQHACDRIKSSERKRSGAGNRKQSSSRKVRSTLKMESFHSLAVDEDVE